jgi:biotin carboxyl carrier protein
MTVVQVVPETGLLDGADRIVVSQTYGRVRLTVPDRYTSDGEVVREGDVVARVFADGQEIDVCAPCDAWVMGYLVIDGERVEPGVAIVHLRAV